MCPMCIWTIFFMNLVPHSRCSLRENPKFLQKHLKEMNDYYFLLVSTMVFLLWSSKIKINNYLYDKIVYIRQVKIFKTYIRNVCKVREWGTCAYKMIWIQIALFLGCNCKLERCRDCSQVSGQHHPWRLQWRSGSSLCLQINAKQKMELPHVSQWHTCWNGYSVLRYTDPDTPTWIRVAMLVWKNNFIFLIYSNIKNYFL
jgi:hypothetical protein